MFKITWNSSQFYLQRFRSENWENTLLKTLLNCQKSKINVYIRNLTLLRGLSDSYSTQRPGGFLPRCYSLCDISATAVLWISSCFIVLSSFTCLVAWRRLKFTTGRVYLLSSPESGWPGEEAGGPPLPFWRHVKEVVSVPPCSTCHPSSRPSRASTDSSQGPKHDYSKTFLSFYFYSSPMWNLLCSLWFIHSIVRSTEAATNPPGDPSPD